MHARDFYLARDNTSAFNGKLNNDFFGNLLIFHVIALFSWTFARSEYFPGEKEQQEHPLFW